MEHSAYPTLSAINRFLSRILEWITIGLMILLTLNVTLAVIARLPGQSFSWYDEVAAIMMAWITYYGSALAALHRRHIGFDTVLLSIPGKYRVATVLFSEAVVLLFFFLMARAGLQVLNVLAGETLISLTWVPVQFTQSVIPIGAVLFMICQILSLPGYLHLTAQGISLDMYDGSTKFSLIAIPMFVLAGAIMNAGGITDKLINFVSAIIGFIHGGLAMVNIGVSLFFTEISGSAVADVAAMGSILIPQMKKRGYSKEFSAAVTSSSASLAIIIPPSIPMILYAASANTSVEQLFVAGIVPGLLGAAGLMCAAYLFAKRYNFPRKKPST